ncbi:helix-turn-helix transcriptional regulator [Lactococcus garvieae subsp. garvieae]|uniref:helix-turn-helix domain-containing protein n=1 Tax=Lactococcus garvieae TaxID=1363 RepID=UPI0005A73474|nr:XRE family transcriptional regulator [Lactococcus garvieae]KAA8712570.1 helix-turn-helix transcriptional regulator [Lactococcus garvieae subsp. garvieae]MDG6192283.1 XRE family transcriptional regulator [Lactococcus garvieae]PCR99052.1 XRE family transcriptional regulator [Lactococcus garvieae]QPR48043.1 helix-turn-helix transcriptional regulator [Lactococcus garvieae]
MEFSERLKKLRLEAGYTQKELAEKINLASQGAYRKYETGEGKPRAAKLEKLASIFNVPVSYLLGETDVRSSYEIVEIMEKLSEPRQLETVGFAKNKLKEQEEENKIIQFNQSLYEIKVFADQGLSAGKGNGISDDHSTYIVYWTKWVNHDYGVPIKGDSMEPDYHDKDIALIQEQPFPDCDGQVCAVLDFSKDASYIKCVTVEDEFLRLVSLNRSVDDEGNLLYEDILLPRDETTKILGKVIESFTPVKKNEI